MRRFPFARMVAISLIPAILTAGCAGWPQPLKCTSNYLNSVNEIQDPGGQFLYLAITGWFILPFCFILDGIDTPLQWAGIDDGGGSVNYTPSTPTPTDTGSADNHSSGDNNFQHIDPYTPTGPMTCKAISIEPDTIVCGSANGQGTATATVNITGDSGREGAVVIEMDATKTNGYPGYVNIGQAHFAPGQSVVTVPLTLEVNQFGSWEVPVRASINPKNDGDGDTQTSITVERSQ